MLIHAYDSSTWEMRWENGKLEANLGYTVSSGPAQTPRLDTTKREGNEGGENWEL